MEHNLTEKKIIAEARRIFMQKGFESTKMDDIAKACNINRPGLNYYFRTKEKLFEAIYKQAVGTALPSLEKILNSGKGLEAVTRGVVEIYMRIIRENPSVPYFLLNECTKDPDRLSIFIKNLGMDIYVRSMENFRKEGKIRDVPLQALLPYNDPAHRQQIHRQRHRRKGDDHRAAMDGLRIGEDLRISKTITLFNNDRILFSNLRDASRRTRIWPGRNQGHTPAPRAHAPGREDVARRRRRNRALRIYRQA